MKELSLALLILAGVAASKCTVHARAPKPGTCQKLTAIMTVSDLDGVETVTTLPYYSCSDLARPQDRKYVSVCYVGDNPFAELLYMEPRDIQELEWLCQDGDL